MSDTWYQAWKNSVANALPALDLAWRTNWALLDIWTATQLTTDELHYRVNNRLHQLVKYALHHSPFYARHWRNAHWHELSSLPPVTKKELMANFDDWACDRRVTYRALQKFLANNDTLGQPFLGTYAVWTSSGTTGIPAIFVQDDNALAVYDALQLARFRGLDLPSKVAMHPFAEETTALVAATGRHFAGVSTTARLQARYPWVAGRLQTFSILDPISQLTSALNQFAPTHMATYPTAGLMLADEQRAGRLNIRLKEMWTGGEHLSDETSEYISATFGCKVRNYYGASEAMSLAYDCPHGALHLQADWMILEPVDKNYLPVAPGETSHTVLLTNLANRAQPIVRYDLGDGIRMSGGRCACGSPFPVIEVCGRCDDVLRLKNATGRDISILPLALETILEDVEDVHHFQIIQTAPSEIQLRLHDKKHWLPCEAALKAFFRQQGLANVKIKYDTKPPQRESLSGKLRRVIDECTNDLRSNTTPELLPEMR